MNIHIYTYIKNIYIKNEELQNQSIMTRQGECVTYVHMSSLKITHIQNWKERAVALRVVKHLKINYNKEAEAPNRETFH